MSTIRIRRFQTMQFFRGAVLFASFAVASCARPTTIMYLDNQYRTASFSDIKTVTLKYRINLDVEWQTNGEHLPALDDLLRNNSINTFRATGVFEPVAEPVSTKVQIVFNNVADTGVAFFKGLGTGLVRGAVGTTVSDFYEVKISSEINNKKIIKNFKHAIHATIGDEQPPVGMKRVLPSESAACIIEDVILKYVKAMQSEGYFIDRNQPQPPAGVPSIGTNAASPAGQTKTETPILVRCEI